MPEIRSDILRTARYARSRTESERVISGTLKIQHPNQLKFPQRLPSVSKQQIAKNPKTT